MLEVKGITRSFGDLQVLSDVGFDVPAGTLTGVVGGRDAGKTTLLRILAGLLDADDGSVLLDGEALEGVDLQRVGYLPQQRGLYPSMRVSEQLVYIGRLHGFSMGAAERNASTLLEKFGIADFAGDRLDTLGLGDRQRVQIAATLVHDPDVILLDAPFEGLDAGAVDGIIDILSGHTDSGVPIVLTTTELSIVDGVADNLVILQDGEVQAGAATGDLLVPTARFEIEASAGLGWLEDISGVTVDELDGTYARFTVTDDDHRDEVSQRVLKKALEFGTVTHFSAEAPTIDELARTTAV